MQAIETVENTAERASPLRWEDDPLLVDVVEVLLALGGAAHRTKVAEALASRRLGTAPGFCRHLYETVEASLDRPDMPDFAAIVHLPFGEGSYRWAISHEAMATLRRRRAHG